MNSFQTCEALTSKGTSCLLKSKIRVKPSIVNCHSDEDPITLEKISEIDEKNLIMLSYNNLVWCYNRIELLKYLKQLTTDVIKFVNPIVYVDRKITIQSFEQETVNVFEFEETDYYFDDKNAIYLIIPFKDESFECNQYCTKHFDKWVESLVDKLFEDKTSGLLTFQNKINYIYKVQGNEIEVKNTKDKTQIHHKDKEQFIEFLKEGKVQKITYGKSKYTFFRASDYEIKQHNELKNNQALTHEEFEEVYWASR